MTISTAERPFALPNDAAAMRERGIAISAEKARVVADPLPDPKLEWFVRFKIPFSSVASKNSIYGRVSDKHRRVFIRRQARAYRDSIGFMAQQAVKGREIKHTKVWIDIFVEKSHHRGDAINVIDLVCDGIKQAIPVDDRWFSLRRVDWSVNKSDPHLFIGIGQEIGAVDSKVCSLCGQIKPLEEFTNCMSSFQQKNYECVECRRPTYNKGPNRKYR